MEKKTQDTSQKTRKKTRLHERLASMSARQLIFYTILLLAWVTVSMYVSQYLVTYLLYWIIGNHLVEPFWLFVDYFLADTLAVCLVVFVPPLLLKFVKKWKSKKSQEQQLEQTLTTNPTEMGVNSWPNFIDIGLAPIAFIVYTVIANFLINIMDKISWINANEEQDLGFSTYMAGQERVFAVLAIVFVAPIAEELIMRGWLYGKLRSKLPIWLAIILVSVLFGALHGQWNVAIIVGMLSVILCGLREITGSIWCGILLHIIVNGMAFYAKFIAI